MSAQQRRLPRVAVIGAGIMGSAMAERLLDTGFAVEVWNRDPEPAQRLAARGATAHGSAAEAAAAAQVAITMLATADVVEAVMLDQGGLDGVPAQGAWVQMGTVGVDATDRLATAVARRRPEVAFVDAPVSGSRDPARTGQLVILASGPEGAVRETLQPVFDVLGRRTIWLGPAGNGSRMKLVLNIWLAFEVEAAAEALAVAEALGVPQTALADAATGSPLVSPFAMAKLQKMQSGDDSTQFPLAWGVKDIELALEKAGERSLPVAAAIAERWSRLAASGLGRMDVSAARHGLSPAAAPSTAT